MEAPKIASESYTLMPFKTSDAELWQKWDTDPEVLAYMPEPFNEFQSMEKQYAYIEECARDATGWYWSIETKDGVTIGTVALTEFSRYHGVTDLGIVIGDKNYWGRGVATEVIVALLDYAFDHLNIFRIGAEVEEGNAPMMKVLKKAGFKQDGFFESARVKKGKRINVYHFGITKRRHL